MYGLTRSSRWILSDTKTSLASFLLMRTDPENLSKWHTLSQRVKEEKVNGFQLYDFASTNPEYNKVFNDAMSSTTEILMGVFLPAYKDGLHGIRTLVDVGGDIGTTLSQIVKAHPQISGINFDLPHVIATAPVHEKVTHIGRNMLEAVPCGDAILMKVINIYIMCLISFPMKENICTFIVIHVFMCMQRILHN